MSAEEREALEIGDAHSSLLFPLSYKGAQGLAEDVRYYGQWMRTEAEKRIGHLYPKVKAWQEPRSGQYFGEPDVLEWQQCVERDERCASGEHVARVCGYTSLASFLSALTAHELTVIAWLWARTVRSPNPAFAHIDVPLASTFMLSTKPGKEAWIEVVTTRSEERGARSEKREVRREQRVVRSEEREVRRKK